MLPLNSKNKLRGLYFSKAFFGGLIFGAANERREMCVVVVGRKFTIFALFYFVFDGKFQVQAPRVAYIRRGDLTEVFSRYDFGGLIFGILRYYSNFSDSEMLGLVN